MAATTTPTANSTSQSASAARSPLGEQLRGLVRRRGTAPWQPSPATRHASAPTGSGCSRWPVVDSHRRVGYAQRPQRCGSATPNVISATFSNRSRRYVLSSLKRGAGVRRGKLAQTRCSPHWAPCPNHSRDSVQTAALQCSVTRSCPSQTGEPRTPAAAPVSSRSVRI